MFVADRTDTSAISSVTLKSFGGPGSCRPSPVKGPKYLDVPFVEEQPEINRPVSGGDRSQPPGKRSEFSPTRLCKMQLLKELALVPAASLTLRLETSHNEVSVLVFFNA